MRLIPFLFLLISAPNLLFPQGPLPPAVEETAEDLREVASFHPRLEGSEGEQKTAAFIASRLQSYGIKYTRFDFSQTELQHSFSPCIRVDVPGRIRDTVIVSVPLGHAVGTEPRRDGAVNVALALGLLRRLKDEPPPLSVTVLFLGAEFGPTPDYPMGSHLFLNDFRPDYRVAVLYLNFRTVPSRVLVRGGGRGIVSPYWLMDRSVRALGEAKLDYQLRGNENQAFRLGLTGEGTIVESFLKEGYPAVSLEEDPADEGAGEKEIRNWLFSFHFFFSNFIRESSKGFPEDWDRHYLIFQEKGASLIITEKTYVILLILVLAATLLYSLIFHKGLKKYIRTLMRNFLSIFPILAVPFVLSMAGTLALKAILGVREFPTLWSYAPLPFLLLKLAITLLLFSVLYGALRKLPFPRRGSFYSASSIFFLLVDIFTVASINISFTYYFLWALFFVLLASMAPNRWLKLILFLPAPYWGIRGLLELFAMPALPFCDFILLSVIRGNLLIAVIGLPFILFIIRLSLVFRGGGVLRRKPRTILLCGVFSAAVIGLGVRLLLYSPFDDLHPQPLSVTQTIDEKTRTSGLWLESPAPIGDVTIRREDGETAIDVRKSSRAVSLDFTPVPVRVEVRESEFLKKKNILLSVSSDDRPRNISVRLYSPQEFILLDSSFPFLRENPREYRLLIGAFPPHPLPIQLTLPIGMSFTVTLELDFDSPLIGVEVLSKILKQETHLHFVKSIDLRT